jgi:hypothetical protein
MSIRVIGVIGLVAAIGALTAVLLFAEGGTTHAAVEVRENGTPVAVAAVDDAVKRVSDKVGFDVVVPAELPGAGLRMLYIDADVGPSEVGAPLKLAIMTFGRPEQDDLRVVVEQAGTRFGAPEDRAEWVDIGLPGVDVYRQETDRAIGYWVLTADRGWVVGITASDRPSEGAILSMLRSLVRR